MATSSSADAVIARYLSQLAAESRRIRDEWPRLPPRTTELAVTAGVRPADGTKQAQPRA